MKFSVLGCGWLGLPLAEFWVKQNHTVHGATTTFEKLPLLQEKGITPFQLKIDDNEIQGAVDGFLNSDILFVNVPFGKQKDNFLGYEKLISKINSSTIKKVIFISSTSVYADNNGTITEETPFTVNPPKQILIDLENLFMNNPNFDTTIIRFSGLIGGTRNPGNFFKEDRIVKNGLAPINLIHLDDCIGIVNRIVTKNSWNEIYNAAADTHPTRKEFYTAATIHSKKEPASFIEENTSFKIISNEKLKTALEYSYIHSDLMKMIQQF